MRALAALPLALLAGGLLSGEARADLRVCNMTASRVGVAVGYRDPQGWITEGWFNLKANSCEAVLKGDLTFKYYYIHAIDYDRGGEWGGRSFMCTREREFSVRGFDNCLARGFDRTGFFEIDTGEQKNWTVQLTEANRQGGQPLMGGPRP
ncbi:MAG: DUF1036 domain-containing protein [Methylocystis sp.]|jgi:uncharacterized membrane protein|nr:DUF1036 domain-containing protein [Methylocystis sp.]MCA3582268.1 DUF1036 domain-containing protein [Methylocystis sp.]MCA3588163.1 DUF1036 domain-containing protein [Methylocystis sp.]MCA3590081.1 DUF1036 domain-containing protein [Methylocystis sp.]